MKLKLILMLSLGANVALAAAYFTRSRPPVAESAPAAAAATNGALVAKAGVKVLTEVVTNDVTRKFDWRIVESEDYRRYIANLRSIGCPEKTIRDIITADVNELFASRAKAQKPAAKFKYWEAGGNMFAGMLDEEKIKEQQALAKEKRALLKELLGVEPEEKLDLTAMMGGANPFESMLDFLTPAKQNQIMELEQKYSAKLMKSLKSGGQDPDDMKEMQNVQKEKDAEMAKLLTPQEKEDYDLRMSQTAMMMRMQMTAFDANEQEFKNIFKAKKQFDDQFSIFGADPNDKDAQASRTEAQKVMNDQIKSALGDSRYQEYQRSQDYTYQGIARLVEKQGLPKETAVQVYDVRTAADAQTQTVQNDNSLTEADRASRLDLIRKETEKTLRPVLGDKGWEAYLKQPGTTSFSTLVMPAVQVVK